jgi:hypothetical protein
VAVLPYKGYQYTTEDDLLISVDNEVIDVPKGFSTDLATIPRPLWSIVSPSRSELIEASILHDYLYSCPGSSSRLEIDEIYYNLLIEEGLSKYIATKFFIAVRLFGSSHFNDEIECYPNDGEIEWIPQN